jgi:S-adenosylmethionine:tRNA ribosyltransferase-isomerase
MRRDTLSYIYPPELIAQEPRADFRIAALSSEGLPTEINPEELWSYFKPGDLLVLNDSQVERRRVFAGELEILFLTPTAELQWEVLLPARDLEIGAEFDLPGGVRAKLLEKGLPQTLELSLNIGEKYFAEFGEPALPPYIQKARGVRHALTQDKQWYQNPFGHELGSSAAPTASLHFSTAEIERLKIRGVTVASLTLHVGMGTFSPIKVAQLEDHPMHSESVTLSKLTIDQVQHAQHRGARIWALGTTVTRALEAWAAGHLQADDEGNYRGKTDLFIRPGYTFQVVSGLMTNFHQPESTLLALVAAFAGLDKTLQLYNWAIEQKMRLFSYGDLTVWRR